MSPAGSQYSVDLAALDLESRSGASSPMPEPHIDRVRSSDIDGPSDFTVNMEQWFRGGSIGKGTGRGTMKSMKKALDSVRETRDEGVQADGNFLTPRKTTDEEQSASHHTPSDSPPIDSVYKRMQQSEPDGEDLSQWNPYTDGEESTPQAPAHTQFQQPTVEDYYSEISPARLPSVRRIKSASSHTHVGAEDGLQKDEPSSPGRPSSETLSPVRSPARSPERSPVLHRSAPRQFSSQSTEAAFERQMEDLQAKCKQLELLNTALSQAADEERRMRADEQAAHARRVADAERREWELNEMKDQAFLQRDNHRNDLLQLKTKVAQLQREGQESRRGTETAREQHKEDIRRISEDAQRARAQRDARIRMLEQDLEHSRRRCDAAEEAERVAKAELERNHADLDQEQDDLDRMQSDLTQIEDPDDRVRELEDERRATKALIEKLSIAKKEAEDEATDVRAELARVERSHDEETARMTGDHRRALTAAENLQTQLKKLHEQFQSEQVLHKAEIDRLRAESSRSTEQSPELGHKTDTAGLEAKQTDLNTVILERDALRDDIEAQQSQLNAAILERDDAQDALATARSSLQQAQDALSDQEAIAAVIDAKVSAAIAKREAYWRGRLEASEKERKVMVKALLRQWGREEVGVTEDDWDLDGRQGYEYQFVTQKRRPSGVDVKAGA